MPYPTDCIASHLNLAILVGGRIVVSHFDFVFLSLKINDSEYLFMSLLTI